MVDLDLLLTSTSFLHCLMARTAHAGRQLVDTNGEGEWIAAVFQENVRLKAVRVRTGRYFTDFPRGLSLEVAVDCSADKLDSTLFTEVYREPATQGEIKFTDSGFPYFGEQYSSVTLSPKAMDVRCFRVLQIGKQLRYFDWSCKWKLLLSRYHWCQSRGC